MFEERAIDTLLLLCDSDRNMDFYFGFQLLLDFALDPSKQERSQNPVKLFNDVLVVLLFFGIGQLCAIVLGSAQVEPLIEVT